MINNSTWQPEVDLELIDTTTEMNGKLTCDLDEVNVWPPKATEDQPTDAAKLNLKVHNISEQSDSDFRANLLSNYNDGGEQTVDRQPKSSSSSSSSVENSDCRAADKVDTCETTKV